MTIRSIRPYRNVGSKRKAAIGESANVHTPGEQIGVYDQPHIYAEEELVPMIVNKTRTALKVDRIPIYYYQRKKWGTICTCWSNTERIPKQDCHVCFGTGRTSGYQKFGTETILMDASLTGLTLINMLVDDAERPNRIELVDGKDEGFAEAVFSIMPNTGEVDNISIFPKLSYDKFDVTISTIDGSTSYSITDRNWISLLAEKQVKVRITIKRPEASDASPYFESLFIRYKTSNQEVRADWPRLLYSVSMEDLGLPDIPQATAITLDDTIQISSVEDYIYNTRDREPWKLVEVTENKPLGLVTGWDLQIRKVQSFEIFSDFPL